MTFYKIMEGDCLVLLPQLEKGSINLIITSPPYNVGKDYGEYKDDRVYEDYLNWLDKIWSECFRVLKYGGRICINVGDIGRSPYYPIHCDIVSRLRKKWFMMGIIIWNKQNCLSNTAWGSWESSSSPHLRGQHEFIIIAGKGGKSRHKYKKDDVWAKNEFVEATLEIWDFPPETRLREHPSPFPEELPKRLMKLYSFPGDVILDPFLGSGTTMKVGQDLGRSCVGIELNRKYCEMARKRCFGRTFLDRPVEYQYEEAVVV